MLARAITAAIDGVSPGVLFQNSEPGVWFDPSDLKTLYQDSAGTTPVTGVEQPVGKMLDKSGNNKHATQSTAGSRPTLSARYNMLTGTDTYTGGTATTLAASYTLLFSGTGTITLGTTATGTYSAGSSVFTATAGTLSLTVNGTVTNAQLIATERASLPYQSVTSSTVYDSDKTKFPWYLRCTDHWMVTPSIDASAFDKVAVFAALRKMSDAATNCFTSFGITSSDNGSFDIFAFVSGTSGTRFVSRGSAGSTAASLVSEFVSPYSIVAIGSGSISSDIARLMINGSVSATSATDQGSGNYGNYALYIGKRTSTSQPFNGFIYGLAVRFASSLPNDNVIAAISKSFAAKAGIKI